MRRFLMTALLALLPSVSVAEQVRDGLYLMQVDGAEGTLRIERGQASLSIVSLGRCVGSVEGSLTPLRRGLTSFTDRRYGSDCTIAMTINADGSPSRTEEGPGCFAYHGASCAFTGEVIGLDVDSTIEALDAAFNAMSVAQRRNLQHRLVELGAYGGPVDGLIGPGTRRAIVIAARKDIRSDPEISLADTRKAGAYLARLLNPPSSVSLLQAVEQALQAPAIVGAAEIDNVLGLWTCASDLFETPVELEFGLDRASMRPLGITQPYEWMDSIGERSNALRIEFADGETIGLFDITAEAMIMMGSGMIFDCSR